MHTYCHIQLVSRRAWQGVGAKLVVDPTASADNAVHARREASPKGALDASARCVPSARYNAQAMPSPTRLASERVQSSE